MVTALAPFPFWEPHAPGGGLALLGAYPRGPGVFVHPHITGIHACAEGWSQQDTLPQCQYTRTLTL